MKHVAPIRQALGFTTIFNFLGPLTNPAGARRQVVGTRTAELADKLLEVLVRLGATRAIVVSGEDVTAGRVCDISVTGATHVAQYALQGDGETGETRRYSVLPEDLGVRRHADSQDLVIRSPEDSAAKVRAVLGGQARGASRDVVLANAGAAIWAGGGAETLQDGVKKATAALDSGAALGALEKLIACSHAR